MQHYALVTHADWGSNPKKRWVAVARWSDGTFHLDGPEPLGEVTTFLSRFRPEPEEARWLAGFDVQIGLPKAYAAAAGIHDFRAWLEEVGGPAWPDFFRVSTRAEEVNLRRPFYPNGPGGRRQAHLLHGLGLHSMKQLLRRCDVGTDDRGAASTLFWTLGSKQVGKGAIIAWRDLLLPALASSPHLVRIWPFDGPLAQLHGEAPITICETYPAEAGTHLGILPPGRGWSKRKQADRAAVGRSLLAHAARVSLVISDPLRQRLEDGFGPLSDGEDPFDATIGLFGMLEVATGRRPASGLLDTTASRIEGWMLGMGEPT